MTALDTAAVTAATAATPPSRRRARRKPPRRTSLAAFLVERTWLIVLAVLFIAPMVFVILASMKTRTQIDDASTIWPTPFRWANFTEVFSKVDLWTASRNSFEYAFLSSVGVVVSSVPVAYALARLQWRGRGFMFMVVLATMMLPQQVTAVPLYVMFVKIGWVNTLLPLIVPSFFGDAFSIFLLRQFFLTIPQEYVDAARVDGAGEFRILLRVVVPLAKPAIAAVGLFSFLYAWNDFFGPLLYTKGDITHKSWTVGVALSELRGLHSVQTNLIMAATVLFMLPVVALFFAAQRVFVEGVTLTGVKG
jgi:multiple sugar transport system permease protein